MELKVWVEGVVRVVCGLSLNTSCQDVVIALAQSIGQTGRYVLILKLRGTERQLVADDRPLEHLAQLGQLAADVQFILRRTGPSLSDGQVTPARDGRFPPPGPPEPEPLKRSEPHKALTFSLGPSTHPKRTKPNRASPEPRASPVSFLEPLDPVKAIRSSSSSSSKEEAFRQILQQQRRLQDLEVQLQALETEVWERERSPGPSLVPEGELEELEQRLRQNEADLLHRERWEEALQTEVDREHDMHRRLQQIQSSIDDGSYQMEELRARSAHLEQDIRLKAHRRSSGSGQREEEEALRPLKQELLHRLQQAEHLDKTLSETQRGLQTAEEKLQGRWEMVEELNKELRQCKLQQFIQQTGSPHADQINLPGTEVYLSNAGIME
ncbi:ras association domain-containing protein 7-like isoform X1 [Sebastes umbrosus]|uniref:ras association domain-containing protein 7-like isoform X1 n=1 Tax=Sebastes umbrosus TaxID=72105 RepID=UPI0018A06A6D|nr:ras association domain-containing protein 7-like isoform X1 [Sebastes umbrosus]XP_037649778.1 ras association domain-containing protein 7-like isoform X1 [Sebastes umbrosus]